MSGHVVCETAPCKFVDSGWRAWQACKAAEDCDRRCIGCLTDGTRVVPVTAVPVERERYSVELGGGDHETLLLWEEVER